MKKSAYLLQKDQLEKDKKEVLGNIEKIETVPSNLPTEGEFEDLLEFSKKVRAKIANEDWDPTPQSKRRLLEMLHVKVVLSKDGTGKVEGWFGETSGFLYTESLRFGRLGRRNGRNRIGSRSRQLRARG